MGRFALVIGNSEYDDQGLSRLKAPPIDVKSLLNVLRDRQIGAFDIADELINPDKRLAEHAIARLFAKRQQGDLILLYFSGHGIRHQNGELYLAVKDTDRNLLTASGIWSGFLKAEMDGSDSRRQVLILDCCHSGAFSAGFKGAKGGSVQTVQELVGTSAGTEKAFISEGYGRIVLTASDSTQYAFEDDHVRGTSEGSIFTRYLVEGLSTGRADAHSDGHITVNDLYTYTYARVIEHSSKQRPQKFGTREEGRLIIAKALVRIPVLSQEMERNLNSDSTRFRIAAAHELTSLISSDKQGVRLAAYSALISLAYDDSNYIRKLSETAKSYTADSLNTSEELFKLATDRGHARAEERRANAERDRLMQESAAKTEEERLRLERAVKAQEERLKQQRASKEEEERREQERAEKAKGERFIQERAAKAEQERAAKAEEGQLKQKRSARLRLLTVVFVTVIVGIWFLVQHDRATQKDYWNSQNSGTKNILLSAFGTSDGKRKWAVSAVGEIFGSEDGKRWTLLAATGKKLRSIFVTGDGQRLWTVGNQGAILNSMDGKSWMPQTSGTEADLLSITGTRDGKRLWAVGSGGVILDSADGEHWNLRATTGKDLYSVFATEDGKRVWTVGDHGAILHTTDGKTWKLLESNSHKLLRSIFGTGDGSRLWAVGDEGQIVNSNDGENWSLQISYKESNLQSIFGTNGGANLWIVGMGGIILESADGGLGWTDRYTSGTSKHLYSIFGASDGKPLTVVGDEGTILVWNEGKRE